MRGLPSSTCQRTLPCRLLLAYVAFVLLAVPLAPAMWRILEYRDVVPWQVAAGGAAFLALAVAARNARRRWPVDCVLTATLLAMHLSVRVQPLGDCALWREWSGIDQVGVSELLANLAFRLAHRWFGEGAIEFVAPAFGALFSFAYLRFCERAFVAPRRAGAVRVLCGAVLLLSGWQLFFCRGYLENSFLSLPFLLPALGHLLRLPDAPPERRRAMLLRASCWLAVASLVHGMHVALLPALLWCLWLECPARRAVRAFAADALRLLAAYAGTVALGVLLLHLCGYAIVPGHCQGGTDDRFFVPFDPGSESHYYAYGMLSLPHFAEVGNIALSACPLFLCLLPMLWRRRARASMCSTAARRPALAIAALGGIGIATVYYFDLGFPLDYDLMVSMCMPVNLCLLQWVARAPRRTRAAAAAGLLAGGCYTWTVMAALLVHDAGPHPLGRAGLGSAQAPGLLTANGRSTEVTVRSGEAVLLELWPPPTLALPATFSILGYHGVPPPCDDARQNGDRGLCFPDPTSPRWDPARVFFVIDVREIGALGVTSPPLTQHWIGAPVRPSAAQGVTTVQALLHDAAGREFTSNAVIVRPSTRQR